MPRLTWMLVALLSVASTWPLEAAAQDTRRARPGKTRAGSGKRAPPAPSAPTDARPPASDEAAPPRAHVTLEMPPPPAPRPQAPVAPPPPAPALQVPTPPSAPEARARTRSLFVGARAGGWAPLRFLAPGYEVGGLVRYHPAWLDARLDAQLFVGMRQAAGVGAVLVPGRGYDPALIANVTSVPVELTAGYTFWRQGRHAAAASLGYVAAPTRAHFLALGAASTPRAVAHLGTGALGYRLTLGGGEVGVELRASAGRAPLGALGRAATDSLTSFSLAASYAVGLPRQASAP